MMMTMRPKLERFLAMLLALMVAGMVMLNGVAFAEETVVTPVEQPTAEATTVPVPTEVPAEDTSPYKVTFTAPSGWTNADSADMTIRVEYLTGLALTKLEYRQSGSWIDATDKLKTNVDGKITITVTDNEKLTVRLTDPHGHVFKESTKVNCFDRTAPTVNAGINGEDLKIRTQDTQSGVAGVQVNGLLFTTMDDGEISITVKDVLSKYEHLAVRTFDYAGNFSEPVTLDNPYYVAPATPTPMPTNTPKPTKAPATATSEATATAASTAVTTAAATVNPYSGSSVVYVPEWTATVATSTPQPVATPTPVIQTVYETEYITLGPGMPYQSDGNSHTLDMLYSAATNKQFISLQTKSGNVFYLVIDYDKPVDEKAEMYETYFLNLVDERDLLALMSDDDKEEVPTPTPQIVCVTPEPTAVPAATAEPVETESGKTDKTTALIALVGILAAGGIGAFLFVKSKKGGSTRKPSSEFDMDDDDEDENSQNE